MAAFSLVAAFVTALIVSLFSGFPGLLPILLFAVLLLLNCECMAANMQEDEKTSMMFMAVISSSIVVLLCVVLVSSNLNTYLCEAGFQDPEKIHPLVPFLTIIITIAFYLLFLRRAKEKRLLVQRFGSSLMASINRHAYNPKLRHIRRTMIKEGILTERLLEDEEDRDYF